LNFFEDKLAELDTRRALNFCVDKFVVLASDLIDIFHHVTSEPNNVKLQL
jgi:hypothetical protein